MLRTDLDQVVLLDAQSLRGLRIDFNSCSPHDGGERVWQFLHPRQMCERAVQESLRHIRLKMKGKTALFTVELRFREFHGCASVGTGKSPRLLRFVAPPSTLFLYLCPECLGRGRRMHTAGSSQGRHRVLQHALETFPWKSFAQVTTELMGDRQERIGHGERIVQRLHRRRRQAYNRSVRTGLRDVV